MIKNKYDDLKWRKMQNENQTKSFQRFDVLWQQYQRKLCWFETNQEMNWKLNKVFSQSWKFVNNKIDENWKLNKLRKSFKNWRFSIIKSMQVKLT